MIDWLVAPVASGPFLTAPDGVLDYEELHLLATAERSGDNTVVYPTPDAASVRHLYRRLAVGPVVVAREWSGPPLAASVMTLMFTSGSTGAPKAVPLSVSNWEAAVSASASHLGNGAGDVWLIAMPLHHVGGLSVLFRSSFAGGRVMVHPRFEAGAFADALAGATMASVVPTMLRRLLDHDRRRYTGLRAVLVGGGPIPDGLIEESWERGIPALPSYGMTETCAQVATLRPGSTQTGRADLLPGVEARTGPEGRVWLRGRQIFSGYLDGSGVDGDGWFKTGDLGVVEGRAVRILGRADDVIVTGGENVDPVQVEAALVGLPGVVEAMVVGVDSPEWGSEVVCLFVGSAPIEDMAAAARRVLDPHQVPKRWVPVDEVPVTPLGKPDRAAGRDIAAGH